MQFNLKIELSKRNLRLRITKVGTSFYGCRAIQLKQLPPLNSWDKSKQRFNEPSELAIKVNKRLSDIVELCKDIIKRRPDIQKPSDILTIYDAGGIDAYTTFNKTMSLREYLENYIFELKNPNIKKKSANYQNYITLLHALEEQGTILKLPVSEITDTEFKQFVNWVVNRGKNMKKLCSNFKATINSAINKGLTKNNLLYKYEKDIPAHTPKTPTISTKDYKRFVDLDVRYIAVSGPNPMFYKQLYKDICIMVFETGMRPVDIITMNYNNIITENDTRYYKYVPEKMKNKGKEKKIPLTRAAVDIINKYKGQIKDYVFSFPCNMCYDDFDKRYRKHNRVLGQINGFLKKVANLLNIDINLTTYSFRRCSINDKLNDNVPLVQVAALCSTSVEMVSRHYTKDDLSINRYIENNKGLYR